MVVYLRGLRGQVFNGVVPRRLKILLNLFSIDTVPSNQIPYTIVALVFISGRDMPAAVGVILRFVVFFI
jgi:hypothetical protein